MNGIIKRKKTSNYAQIHNNPLQNLEDIRSIGLLSHLMSMPETWEIKKMQLYDKFGRGPIVKAVTELESKKHWIDIKYRDGKNNYHYYNISDIPFSDEESLEFMEEVVEAGYKVLDISEPFRHLLSSVENQQLKESHQINVSSIDDFQQLNINNSFSTVENQHLLNKDINKEIDNKKTNKNKYLVNKVGNKETKSIDDIIYSLTNEYRTKGLSKDVCIRVIDEVMTKKDELHNFGGYLRNALENSLYRSKVKHGLIDPAENLEDRLKDSNIPHFDWLNN